MRLEEIRPSIWDSVIEVMEASLTELEFDGEDIEIDWRIGANARKMDRELYEQYGVFKDVILDERFQRIKTYVQDNVVLDFNFLMGDPLMPLATSIVILFLMHKRVSNDLLALAGAFVFNVNPLYVVLFYTIYNLTPTWTGNSKPKQFVSAKEQQAQAQAVRSSEETVYDHVLIGADIGTLYTAALLARVGHSCCVLQPADAMPLEILPNPSRSDLPPIPTKNLSIGKIERYQVLFDMLCSSPEDFTRRFTFSLIGSDDGSFTHTVMKMRKTISNVKKDLWCLRPDEVSLASDVASKLLLNKNRLEAFLIAVSRTQDFLSQFLNSRAVPSSLTLSVARGELAKQIYNLASESISSTYGAFKIAAPATQSAAASAAVAAAAGTGAAANDGEVGEGGVDGPEAEAVEEETEEEGDSEAVQLLLERVAIVGADEMTIVPSDCSGLGLALALTQSTIGSFYPEGGPAAIAAFLRGVIEKAGGRIVTDVSVKEIDTKGEDEAPVASGVLLQDGTRFAASKTVISGTGILHTYQELLTKSAIDALTPNPLKEIEDVVESAPRALVFFWLEGSAEECGLSGADYVDFGGSKKGMLARLWSPSAKDATWEQRCVSCLALPLFPFLSGLASLLTHPPPS